MFKKPSTKSKQIGWTILLYVYLLSNNWCYMLSEFQN